MEEKINIAEILKNKPEGISLYSSVFGGCVYRGNCDNCIEVVTNNCYYFNEKGHYITNGVKSENGECLLFPSNEMRDWSKFDWKKGDVLVSNDGDNHIIFKDFSKDDYTIFEGKYWISVSKNRNIYCLDTHNTQNYHIENNKKVAQTYIKTIEKRLGGKLNRETLEVENTQPEFKDGDIVVYGKSVAICRKICKHTIFPYVSIDETYRLLFNDNPNVSPDECRFATEAEKQQLFSALEKEGKAWNSEKKQIVDLKQKWTPNPFDKVITRNAYDDIWTANIFSHINQYGEFVAIGCVDGYSYCLPYNEKTAKLIGTTNNWDG